MMWDKFHFLRPELLWLFVVLGVFLVLLYRRRRQTNSWLKVCDPQLVSYLLVGKEGKASLVPLLLLFMVGSLSILALAGPAWQKLPQPVFNTSEARVYVLDLSRSMDATDIKPSRITLAKLKLIDFLKLHKDGQVGLVVFAGMPHVVSPLTDDTHTIVSLVPSLSTAIMPVQGSHAEKAIQRAYQLLKQAGAPKGDMVLITDGVDLPKVVDTAQQIAQTSYRLHVVGVGTAQGAPIPVGQSGFLKDQSGAIVIPKLDRDALQELALAGGGKYVDMSVDDSDIQALNRFDRGTLDKTIAGGLREVDLWRDEGHWLVILALPLAALGFRRGWLGVLLLSLSFAPMDESLAFEWQDLWQRKDQQAQHLLQQGQAEEAAKLFSDPERKGAAYYRAGDYEKAAEYFARSDSIDAKYNYANALAMQGKLEEALSAYDAVLKQQPNHKDAMFNRELIKKALQQQKQDQGQSDSDQQQNASRQSEDQQNQSQDRSQSDQQQQQAGEQQADKQQGDEQQQEAQQSQDGESQKKPEDAKEQQQDSQQGQEAEQQKQKASESENSEQREIRQATEQWLRRIPDDPGGLLREKFRRQSLRSRQRTTEEEPW